MLTAHPVRNEFFSNLLRGAAAIEVAEHALHAAGVHLFSDPSKNLAPYLFWGVVLVGEARHLAGEERFQAAINVLERLVDLAVASLKLLEGALIYLGFRLQAAAEKMARRTAVIQIRVARLGRQRLRNAFAGCVDKGEPR